MRSGTRDVGIHAPFFALWAPTYYKDSEAVRRTLELRDAMQTVFDKYPDQIELAVSASDVERIIKQKKIAVVLAVEGGHQIASDLAVLRMYGRLGVRSMTLTHFRNTDWADSSTDNPAHNGLTEFGKEVVREMNRIGMIIDVSHVSDKTFYDVLEATRKPVIASHSSCRALCDVPRNMSDDMLRALARNGGVVGINFGARFLNSKDAQGLKQNIAHFQVHLKRPVDLLALLSEQTGLSPSHMGFYCRAFGGLVTRTAADYNYGGNWTISTGGTFTR